MYICLDVLYIDNCTVYGDCGSLIESWRLTYISMYLLKQGADKDLKVK